VPECIIRLLGWAGILTAFSERNSRSTSSDRSLYPAGVETRLLHMGLQAIMPTNIRAIEPVSADLMII